MTQTKCSYSQNEACKPPLAQAELRPVVYVPCPILPTAYAGWLFQISAIADRNADAFEFRFLFPSRALPDRNRVKAIWWALDYALGTYRRIRKGRRRATVLFPAFFGANVILAVLLFSWMPYVVRVSGGELQRGNGVVWFLRTKMIQRSACAIALNHSDFRALRVLGVSERGRRRIPNPVADAFKPATAGERSLARSSLGLAATDFVIGVVGTLCPRKGQLDLVRAVTQLGLRNVVVILCGPSTGHNEADRDYFHLCLAEAATFNLRILHEEFTNDVRAILWSLDVFALPSRSEGMPNALLEAMGCGCPCVATDIAGVCDIIKDAQNGLLVPPGNLAEFTAALSLIITDRELAKRLGEAAEATIRRHYSPKDIDGQYLSILRSVSS